MTCVLCCVVGIRQSAENAQRVLARKERWEHRVIRHLKRVVADPKLMARVPKGSLDGFIRAQKEGKV